jgi:ubiquinone biosynthesis protein COQ4
MSFSSPTARVEDGLYLPEGASVFTRLRVAIRALRVLEKKPDDSVAAPLFNASLDGDRFEALVRELSQSEEGRALLRARPSMQGSSIDLDALRAMPEGTLGRAFAKYFDDNKIQPFESPYEVRNAVDYLVKRYRETHDLVHVLTGYGTDALGEMELQAFALGNLSLRTSALILLFAATLQPHGLPPIWRYTDKLRAAFSRGRRSAKIVAHPYERFFSMSVEDARRALRIAEARSAQG